MDRKELQNRMFYHQPDEKAAKRHKTIQQAAFEFGKVILDNTDAGREQSLAMTKLEEVKMWANASVAHEPHREAAPQVSMGGLKETTLNLKSRLDELEKSVQELQKLGGDVGGMFRAIHELNARLDQARAIQPEGEKGELKPVMPPKSEPPKAEAPKS